MLQGKVGIMIGCVDYRLHLEDKRILDQVKQILGVEYLYVRTAAGPDGKLLAMDHHTRSIVEDVQLLIDAKGASVVAVVAHHDCAGHPVSNDQHEKDVVRAAGILKERLWSSSCHVKPLIACLDGEDWRVRPTDQLAVAA